MPQSIVVLVGEVGLGVLHVGVCPNKMLLVLYIRVKLAYVQVYVSFLEILFHLSVLLHLLNQWLIQFSV